MGRLTSLHRGCNTYCALLVVMLLSLLCAFTAAATEITVTTTGDVVNSGDGVCSLREAVLSANLNAANETDCPSGQPGSVATDVIVLSAATYTLTNQHCLLQQFAAAFTPGQEAECDDLDVTDNLLVRGAGKEDTIIRVDPAEIEPTFVDYKKGYFRIFEILAQYEQPVTDAPSVETAVGPLECNEECAPTTTLTVEDLTLREGSDCGGGAISSRPWTPCSVPGLVLSRVKATENSSWCSGGAIYSSGGFLTVSESDIVENEANGPGGGIDQHGVYFCQAAGTVAMITDSAVDGNTSYDSGGGIAQDFYGGGGIGDRRAIRIFGSSSMLISGSTVDHNGAEFAGGGIANGFADLTVVNSTVNNNHGVVRDFRIPNFFEGADVPGEAPEDAPEFGPLFGGGIYNTGAVIGGFFPVEEGGGEVPLRALNVEDSEVSGNKADIAGGGISNQNPGLFGCGSPESLRETRSVAISEVFGFCGQPGSVNSANIAEELESEVNVTGSTISGNTSLFGGGIHHAILTARFNIGTSTIAENLALLGGGILNRWVMEIDQSTISANRAVFFEQELEEPILIVAPAADEPTDEETPSLFPLTLGGGGGILNAGNLVATNSTISGNETQGSGAGVLNLTGPLYYIFYLMTNPDLFEVIEDTRVLIDFPFDDDDDDEDDDDGGEFPEYGFDELPAPGTSLRNVTVTDNEVIVIEEQEERISPDEGVDIDGIVFVHNGGGVATYMGDIAVRNTIVAGNRDSQENEVFFFEDDIDAEPSEPHRFEDAAPYAPDCYEFENVFGKLCDYILEGSEFAEVEGICQPLVPSITSEQYNLIGDNTGCDPFDPTNEDNDKVGTGSTPINAVLGPLQDNGGATETHLLLLGSPAIDMGNPTGAISASADGNPADYACAPVDQRDVARPIDGDLDGEARCDIGAVEVEVDCFADPTGEAVLDECGVCGGDGSSCAPQPTPPDVQCEEVDITENLFRLDGGSFDLKQLAKQVAKRYRRLTGKKRAARKIIDQAEALYLENWTTTWSISSIIRTNCTGGTQCVEVSNVDALSTYQTNANALHRTTAKAIRKLRRAGVASKLIKRLKKKNNNMLAKALAETETVPASTTECTI